MVQISVQVQTGKIRNRLSLLNQRMQDMSPALNEVGEYMLLATDQRYENEIDPNGIPWQPNSPYTLRLKRERGQIQKILQATGRMRDSYFTRVTGNTMVLTNSLERARKHQLGIKVAKRQHLGISEIDRQEILTIINRYINGNR